MTSQKTTTATNTDKHVDHSYITKLLTFSDRGQAIAKRLEEVKANPKYQALAPEHQAKVRADLYKKYVPASYSSFHLPVPDEKTWVGATGRDTTLKSIHGDKKLSETYSKDHEYGFSFDYDAGVGFNKALDQMDLFGTKIANRAFMAMHNLHEHFFHEKNLSDLIVPGSSEAKDLEKFKKNAVVRAVQNHQDALEQQIQSADFWSETHPRNTVLGSLGSATGEAVATLPLYEAVASERFIAGVGAKILPSLTAKLVASPVGMFVAKRLTSATDLYLSTLATTGGDKGTAQNVTLGAEIGKVALESTGLGKAGRLLKIAAAPLIKKWTANTIAMGGKPLAQELANSAMAEVEHEASLEEAHEGEGLAQIKRVEQIKTFQANIEGAANARAERAQQIKDWKQKQEDRAKFDPIMHKLHQGEKVSLNSIAIAQYGKELNQLSKNQRGLALAKRMELIEQAANEAPVHLPDLHKDEVEHNIQEARKANPIMNSLMQQFESMGVKFADAVTDNSAAEISRETGISNVKGAAKKIDKAAKASEPNASASLNPSNFASLNASSIASLRAPRNRTQFMDAISDRSKAGANKFIDFLKDKIPGNIHFEDPAHMMLFFYGNRKELTKTPQGEAIVRTLRDRLRQTKGYDSFSAQQLDQAAKHLHNHMYDMAKSGHLVEEGNIYRSTQTNGPMGWSKWQAPLSNEADAETIAATEKALKNHPQAQKTFKTLVKTLQKNRASYQTPEEYAEYKRILADSSKTLLGHATTGDATIFGK